VDAIGNLTDLMLPTGGREVRVMLLCGADVLQSMNTPGVGTKFIDMAKGMGGAWPILQATAGEPQLLHRNSWT
jgi:hypothetical protein